MSLGKALVVGGTGPTGPSVVHGLAQRGYDVTILHTGQHEYPFGPEIGHIHADPHFADTFSEAIGADTFALVVVQYGRLRAIAEVLRGRAEHVVAIGAATGLYAPTTDERWGALGRPQLFPDTTSIFRRDEGAGGMDKLRYRIVQAMERLFELHPTATYVGYTWNYGPRNPGATDWSTVRRILDGRRTMIVADGGIKLESRVFTENAAAAVLAVVDAPGIAAGRRYTIADERVYSIKQRIEFIAAHLGVEIELIDLPYDIAWPCHPYYRHERKHRLIQSNLIRDELDFEDPFSVEEGLARTTDWLLAHRPNPGDEAERQLGDPFSYDEEDRLASRWRATMNGFSPGDVPQLPPPGHIYRHPKTPGEEWTEVGA